MTDTATSTGTQVLPEDLMNSVLGKLYDTLTSGDDEFLAQRQDFFAWATPGIPLAEDQFDFMGGFLPQAATVEEREALAARRFALAADFSRMVDFVPDPIGVFDAAQQTTVLAGRGSTVSGEYERVLRLSQVADHEISEEDQARIDRFTDLLVTTRTEKDLITDEEREITEDSALVKRYNELYAAYEAAALEFNAARIDALSGNVAGAQARFSINGPILGRKVRAALDAWEATGRRNEIDQMRAFISHVTGRSMVLHRRNLIERFERSKLSDAGSGVEFLYTALTPANVLRSSGWTRFTFNRSHIEQYASSSTNRWGAKGKVTYGLSLGGEASGSTERSRSTLDTSEFELSFEMIQVPIARPWMERAFLTSRGWRFDGGQQPLSDGEEPPSGTLVAYPETMVLARDVSLKLSELSKEESALRRELEAKGKVGWGPFSLGGSYSRASSEEEQRTTTSGQGLQVEGAQIIGYRCHVLGKTPDPDPDVERWV